MERKMETKKEILSELNQDDLTQIRGIANSVANRLNQAGITSYARLAQSNTEELHKILAGLVGFSANRIERENWIGQAGALAVKAQKSFLNPQPTRSFQQHYSGFMVILLLDGEQRVRRTRVTHMQSEKEESWAGWDLQKLAAFFEEASGLEFQQGWIAMNEKRPEPISSERPSPMKEINQPINEDQNILGKFSIQAIKILDPDGDPTGIRIPAGHIINLRLFLDTTSVVAAEDLYVTHKSFVYAKKIGGNESQLIGKSDGYLQDFGKSVIDVNCQALSPGDYRLEAVVILNPISSEAELNHQLMAISEGHFLSIYTP
jgi:hypothetical protein